MNLFKCISTSLMILGLTATASAKVTLYSNSQALQKVISSPEILVMESQYGDVSKISVMQVKEKNTFQSFVVTLTFSMNTSVGPRSCRTKATVSAIKKDNNPYGIVTSVMTEPKIKSAVCEE